jgi:hypothetical protein
LRPTFSGVALAPPLPFFFACFASLLIGSSG